MNYFENDEYIISFEKVMVIDKKDKVITLDDDRGVYIFEKDFERFVKEYKEYKEYKEENENMQIPNTERKGIGTFGFDV